MTRKLEGKVAVITGATSGMALAIAYGAEGSAPDEGRRRDHHDRLCCKR